MYILESSQINKSEQLTNNIQFMIKIISVSIEFKESR